MYYSAGGPRKRRLFPCYQPLRVKLSAALANSMALATSSRGAPLCAGHEHHAFNVAMGWLPIASAWASVRPSLVGASLGLLFDCGHSFNLSITTLQTRLRPGPRRPRPDMMPKALQEQAVIRNATSVDCAGLAGEERMKSLALRAPNAATTPSFPAYLAGAQYVNFCLFHPRWLTLRAVSVGSGVQGSQRLFAVSALCEFVLSNDTPNQRPNHLECCAAFPRREPVRVGLVDRAGAAAAHGHVRRQVR